MNTQKIDKNSASRSSGNGMSDPVTSIIVQADEGQKVHAFGNTIQVKLAAEQTHGSLLVGLAQVPVGSGPPPHRHQHEDELTLILEGRCRFLINGAWVEAGPGSVIYMPRGVVHTFENIGDTPGKAWVLTTPSGFESFFGKCATVFAEANGGPPDIARIVAISDEHGIEYVPPLL